MAFFTGKAAAWTSGIAGAICFASIGIQVRQHIVEGQYPSAKRISESFHHVAEEQEEVQLFANMEAFEAWLSMYTGSGDRIREFIEKTEKMQMFFTTLDRYRTAYHGKWFKKA